MKKTIVAILIAIIAFGFVSCGKDEAKATASEPQKLVFKVGHDSGDTVPCSLGLAKFEEIVEAKTNGQIDIQIYNNATLGSANDYVVNCMAGTLDMGSVNQSVLSSYVEDLEAMDIPYLLADYDMADACYLGEVGKYYSDEIREKTGLEVIGIWEVGFRELSNSKHAVGSMADVKGLRIRTMDNRIHQDFWKSIGADPVPMSWGEAYTAMQQGAIDGCENPISVLLNNNVAGVNNHLAITNHVYSSQPLIVSPSSWAKLTPEQQQIFRDAAYEAGLYEREVQRQQAAEGIAKLEEQGMSTTYPDVNEFYEFSKGFKAKYADKYGHIFEMVDRAAKN